MLTILYSADGHVVSDLNAMAWAEDVLDMYGSMLYMHATAGTEAMIQSMRVLIARGRISPEEICFQFEEETIIPDKHGMLPQWPRGFVDTVSDLTHELISARLKDVN